MRSSSLALVVSVVVFGGVACDTGRYGSPDDVPRPPPVAEPVPVEDIVTDGVELPSFLSCVSAPLDGTTDILRVQVTHVDGAGTVRVQRGPQFWSHGDVWAEPGAIAEHQVTAEDGRLVAHRGPGGTLTVALERDGDVFRGTLEDDQCYLHVETALTCWNDLELWGSPWAGIPGSMDARWDWETSSCLDSAGEPALNELPIEVVRETGMGECADLRGQALNGNDYTGPDLQSWNLFGAQLDGATLFFADLQWAMLNGADLSDLQYGYANIDGYVSDDTELPDGCNVESSPWGSPTVTCAR